MTLLPDSCLNTIFQMIQVLNCVLEVVRFVNFIVVVSEKQMVVFIIELERLDSIIVRSIMCNGGWALVSPIASTSRHDLSASVRSVLLRIRPKSSSTEGHHEIWAVLE